MKPFLLAFLLSSPCFFVAANSLFQVPFSAVLAQPKRSPDNQYSYGESEHQYVAVWLSQKQVQADILFIHGGCWLSAFDMVHTHAISGELANNGFNVFSLEYRRTGESKGGWPITYQDIQSGYEMLVENSLINPSKTLIVGHSAGGHLGLLLAAKSNMAIGGLVGLAPITDIATYAQGENSCQTAGPQFMGGSPQQKPNEYKQANPISYPLHPNTWFLFGDADNIVDEPQRLAFPALPTQRNRVVEKAAHFDFIHAGTHAWSVVIDTLNKAAQAL